MGIVKNELKDEYREDVSENVITKNSCGAPNYKRLFDEACKDASRYEALYNELRVKCDELSKKICVLTEELEKYRPPEETPEMRIDYLSRENGYLQGKTDAYEFVIRCQAGIKPY